MLLPPLVQPVDALPPDEVVRAARQLRLPEVGELGQRRLAAAKVAVIGAGGLGSPVLLYLASAGVGTIGIVDDDVVDATNLQRQIAFGTADVGRPKAAVAAERVSSLSPHTVVVEHRERLNDGNATELLAAYDVVVDGSDTFETRYAVADACTALGIPLVWGSVLRFDAQATVFWSNPPLGSPFELRDVFPLPPAPADAPSCADAGVLGALCGQVGGILSSEVVKLVCGVGDSLLGRMLVIDALTARTSEVPLLPQSAAVPPRRSATSTIPRAALRRIGRGELAALHGVTFVDVREPDEFGGGSIPGALSVPLGRVTAEVARIPADGPVIMFCQGETRARAAARMLLAERPDADVRVLDGGYAAWSLARS
jgi:adenylyltransferase/sulfurtransferase